MDAGLCMHPAENILASPRQFNMAGEAGPRTMQLGCSHDWFVPSALPLVQAGKARNMSFSGFQLTWSRPRAVNQSFLILAFPVIPPRDHYAIRYLMQATPLRLACPLSLRVVGILAKQGMMARNQRHHPTSFTSRLIRPWTM